MSDTFNLEAISSNDHHRAANGRLWRFSSRHLIRTRVTLQLKSDRKWVKVDGATTQQSVACFVLVGDVGSLQVVGHKYRVWC